MKPIFIYFPHGNPGADLVLEEFLGEVPEVGIKSDKRYRRFETVSPGEKWTGTIVYGDNHCQPVIVSRQPPVDSLPDWCVCSPGPLLKVNGQGSFHTSGRKIAGISGLPLARRRLVLYRQTRSSPRSAANQLAGEITGKEIIDRGFITYPGGQQGPHQQLVSSWLQQQVPIKLISAACLHANEDKAGITDRLDERLVELVTRVAKASVGLFPGVTSWEISTFGPQDYDWLGDLGITKVLLPYMWDAPREKVMADLAHNLQLTEGLVAKLNQVLSIPVTCHQMSDSAPTVDIDKLVVVSQQRAQEMMPGLSATPPAIFAMLNDQERFDRIQQEAFLYLLHTVRYGQVAKQERPPTLYIGLEVHGGYWAHGNLFYGPNEEFLPTGWFPQPARQHWAPWAAKNSKVAAQRQLLQIRLREAGY